MTISHRPTYTKDVPARLFVKRVTESFNNTFAATIVSVNAFMYFREGSVSK